MSSPFSAYFIPTHRDASEAMQSFSTEIDFVQREYGYLIPLVLVDESGERQEQRHRSFIQDFCSRHPGVGVIHVTREVQRKFFEKVCEGEPTWIAHFLSTEMNYGRVMNKIYLFAAALGVDRLHRRDSDTRLLERPFSSTNDSLYPLQIEIEHLGFPVDRLSSKLMNPGAATGAEHQLVVHIGGTYFGEWNADFKAVARYGMEHVYRIMGISGLPSDCVQVYCDNQFRFDPPLPTEDDIFLVAACKDDGIIRRNLAEVFGHLYLFPDCGNASLFKVFKHLPVVPARNTISVDYFTFDVTNGFGMPVACHKRKVLHVFGPDRQELERLKQYWYGWAKSVDYFRSYSDLYEKKLPDYIAFHRLNSLTLESNFNANHFADLMGTITFKSFQERTQHVDDLANCLENTKDERFRKIANYLRGEKENMVREISAEYKLHQELIRLWPRFVQNATNASLEPFSIR